MTTTHTHTLSLIKRSPFTNTYRVWSHFLNMMLPIDFYAIMILIQNISDRFITQQCVSCARKVRLCFASNIPAIFNSKIWSSWLSWKNKNLIHFNSFISTRELCMTWYIHKLKVEINNRLIINNSHNNKLYLHS